jgi:RNase H-fold protein (predicted Holliday junction resolvase)
MRYSRAQDSPVPGASGHDEADVHLQEERLREVAAGSKLSQSEMSHMCDCHQCVDALANIAREIVQKWIDKRNSQPPENG